MDFKLCRLGIGNLGVEFHEPSFLIGDVKEEGDYVIIEKPVFFTFQSQQADQKDLTKGEVKGTGKFYPLAFLAVGSKNGIQDSKKVYIPKTKVLYIAPLSENNGFAKQYRAISSEMYSGIEI